MAKNKKYIVSDLHFGHKIMLHSERKGLFKNTDEHDDKIINSINEVVKEKDILYILGDIGRLERVKDINGTKILIKGNHDKLSNKRYLEYFDKVYNHPVFVSRKILLSHYPEMVSPYILNIHGHLHGSYLDSKNHINANIHMIDYRPLELMEMHQYVNDNLPKENTKFLYEWYADKQIFLNKDREDIVVNKKGKILLKESREALAAYKRKYGLE